MTGYWRSKKMVPTDPAALRRLEAAWKDNDVKMVDILKRFGAHAGDVSELTARFGPRPKLVSLSDISRQKHYWRPVNER